MRTIFRTIWVKKKNSTIDYILQSLQKGFILLLLFLNG